MKMWARGESYGYNLIRLLFFYARLGFQIAEIIL